MAVDDAYADATTYRNRISKTDNSQDAAILLGLKAISRAIERRLHGRFFTQDATVVARVYDPPRNAGATLYVDDIATTAGLIVKCDEDRDGLFTDETGWTLDTDFVLIPANADKGPEPEPYTGIVIPSWSSKSWNGRIQVTAKFGWPAIPQAIVEATIQIAGILRIESPRATTRIAEGVDKQIDESKDSKSIIDELVQTYARHGRGVFA